MANFDANKIRNIVFLGHQSAGKTSLLESLYFVSGGTKNKGEVEKKNTVSDYTVEEQKRGASLQTAVVPIYKDDYKINIIDVPGNDDFVSEYLGALAVVDGAVLVIDASTGVQVGTIKHYNALRRKGIPTIIFANKMDKEGVDTEAVLVAIKEQLHKEAVCFAYPHGNGDSFNGYVDLVKNVYIAADGKVGDIPSDLSNKAEELHNVLLEEVAKTDDVLLEKFFGGEQFTNEEIIKALKKGVSKSEFIPIFFGNVLKNIGVDTLLGALINFLPSPVEAGSKKGLDESNKETVRQISEDETVSAYVFKTLVDPYSGVINLVKVVSGVLRTGEDVAVDNNGSQRVSMLNSVSGKTLSSTTELGVGDIGAITRLDGVSSGMTLSSPKNKIVYPAVGYPAAVIFKAISVANKNDESKIGPSLSKIQLEDPCVEVKRNNETRQLLLGGVSDSHINYVIEKLKNNYKIEVSSEPMKVVYRESIKATAEGDGRYVKQSGGSGFYGVVKMRFEPAEENVFAEEVFGGAVPKNYFPAVEKGFFEVLNTGLLAGFPVIGVKGVLVDGKYHPVDSNEQAFRMAGILAFKDAYMKCKPIILEPIMRVHVIVPSQYTGDVMSDLNTRRARIQNMEEHEGMQDIEALVPEAEIVDYVTQLKSITQASGNFTREFVSYEEVPEYLKEKVIRENRIDQ
ncbi:MAG TPA: elongation factor G [Erysipelotrichaceae bacterium]|nr:elongation factor G [Erysipelotrichaceae bacterium]